LGHRYTSNPEAYDAYLRGRFAVRYRIPQFLPDAVKLFEQSARLDPGFALAYYGLQSAYGIAAGLGIMRPSEALPLAQAATDRALQLTPALAEAHVGAAYQQLQLHHNLAAAIAEAERSVQLDPNLPEARHAYAHMLFVNGQFDKSLEQERAVVRLDPEWSVARPTCIAILLYAGRYRDAEEEARSLQPYSPSLTALVLIYQHRYREANQELSAAVPPLHSSHEFLLAWAQAGLGRPELIRDLLKKKLELRRKQYVPSSQIAALYAIMQDRANTLTWMNTAIEEHDSGYYLPTLHEQFGFLRNDPEYQQLRRKMFTPH
jgi:tetratricopeptide (TPR) repeat protein